MVPFQLQVSVESSHVMVRVLENGEEARDVFRREGNQFVAPKVVVSAQGSPAPAPDFDPPILSNESFPNCGDENFVWRGYSTNIRGVVKMRAGRLIVEVNAGTVEDAERLSRRLVSGQA